MNFHRKLLERKAAGMPLRVAVIGAGKFGTMYLAQARRTPGVHLVGVADFSVPRAREALTRTGWVAEQFAARSLDDAAKAGATHVGDDVEALIAHPAVDIIIEVTGNPIAAVGHALKAFAAKEHIVMAISPAPPAEHQSPRSGKRSSPIAPAPSTTPRYEGVRLDCPAPVGAPVVRAKGNRRLPWREAHESPRVAREGLQYLPSAGAELRALSPATRRCRG